MILKDILHMELAGLYQVFFSLNTEWGAKALRKFCFQIFNCKQNKWNSHIQYKIFICVHIERTCYNIWKCVYTQFPSAEVPLSDYCFRSDYSLNALVRRWKKFQGFYSTPLGPWPIKSGKAVHVNRFLIRLGCTKEI